MKPLYDYAEDPEWAQFSELLASAETDEEIEQAFGYIRTLQLDAERAARRVIETIRNLEAEQKALAVEIARLQARKAAREDRETRIRNFAADYLTAQNLKNIKTPIGTICRTAGSRRLIVDAESVSKWAPNELAFAESIGAVKRELKINKDALKTIEGYENLPGVSFAEARAGIQVR